jgi:hypothetical protein
VIYWHETSGLKEKTRQSIGSPGFYIEFGCGDLQPSQIALRGGGLMILDELICACLLNVRWNQNPATSLGISSGILKNARNITLDGSTA